VSAVAVALVPFGTDANMAPVSEVCHPCGALKRTGRLDIVSEM
jgi:hypothetical protein